MPAQTLFHIALLAQLLLMSYLLPRKLVRHRHLMLETYPPAKYPKLYPRPLDHYERSSRRYWIGNLVVLAVGLVVLGLLVVNPRDGEAATSLRGAFAWVLDLGDSFTATVFFFIQLMPLLLLDFSQYRDLQLMREQAPTRRASLQPRRLFDFVSPAALGIVAVTYIAFSALIVYLGRFDYPWFGGSLNILGVTLMNVFLGGLIWWQAWGGKLNPHEAADDRARRLEATVTMAIFVSVTATVFIAITIGLAALEQRPLQATAQSIYFQLLAVISYQIYFVKYTRLDVYKADAAPA